MCGTAGENFFPVRQGWAAGEEVASEVNGGLGGGGGEVSGLAREEEQEARGRAR
jgi:hypothetical protein